MARGFLSIKNKIILLFFGASLLIAALGAASFFHSLDEADKIAQLEAAAIAKTIAFSLTTDPWGPQISSELQFFIKQIKNNLNRDIVVLDTNQKILADAVEEEVGTEFTHDPNDEIGQTIKDGTPRAFTEVSPAYPGGIKILAFPLIYPDGRTMGALTLEYTPLYNEMLALAYNDIRRLLFFYIVVLGLNILAGYALAVNLSRSIGNIQNASNSIAAGNLAARADADRQDELGALAASFNTMARSLDASQKDIVATNAGLRESERRLTSLIDAIPDAVFFKDAEGRHLLVNKATEKMFGISTDAMLGKSAGEIFPPAVAEQCRLSDQHVLEGRTPIRTEEHVKDKAGNPLVLDTTKVPLYDESGRPAGLVGIARDVTARKLMEQALMESEERFRHMFESASDAIFVLDTTGHFIDVNRTAHERLGYTKDEMLSMHVSQLDTPEYAARVPERMAALQKYGRAVFDSAHVKKDGSVMFVEVNAQFIEIGGRKVCLSFIRDITERKRAEESIRASLREKEVLMQEIHHRVKNNLAIINSLLRLQSKHVMSAEAITAIRESQNRIYSMALIHERLYREKNFLRINIREYVKDLVDAVCASYRVGSARVSRSIEVDEILLDIDTLIPCGLMINEMVTNSLKHAFHNLPSPAIKVSMSMRGDGSIRLSVSDNGHGMPEGISVQNSQSLGLQIIDSLVMQLRGSLELERPEAGGTAFSVIFRPLQKG